MAVRWTLVLLAWSYLAIPIQAEHADIDLLILHLDSVTGVPTEEGRSSVDREPPAGGLRPRPVIPVKANDPLALQFVLINTYPHGEKKDVTVRYFVVREEKTGQKTLPGLGKDVVTQGRFTLNFKPKCRVGARVCFTLKERGVYLLRVETLNTDSDHEHFSAIDLRAE
ncbi:MAG TPA: hypothetical protein VKU02_31995 [Gemmataceae bacterium]|nr:hypothetical protein [Gemmataceae bacterium]